MNTKPPFEMVVTEHAATVLRVCRAVLGSHTDADDAWSETFLAALTAWPQLPDGANVEAWLVTIAHRKAIDVTRARQRHAIPTQEIPERAAAIDDSDDQGVWAAVQKLPPKQRQAVAYRYFGGLRYQDIANLVGGTTDAARRAAADGITSLRTVFADAEPKGATR